MENPRYSPSPSEARNAIAESILLAQALKSVALMGLERAVQDEVMVDNHTMSKHSLAMTKEHIFKFVDRAPTVSD